MDDVISRQIAIEILGKHCNMDYGKVCGKDCECMEYMALRDTPSAQQWIPCSERLPNYDEEVLVDYHGRIRLASLTKNDKEYPWYFIVSRFNAKLETVKAWMPLPEPYREEVSDHDR